METKENIPTNSQKAEITPEELKENAMHALGYVVRESREYGCGFQINRREADAIVTGWELLDEEIKKLALASIPGIAIALLDAKINKK